MGSLLDNIRNRLFGDPTLQKTGLSSRFEGAATAFSTLIEGVGKTVATTQRELDETSGQIATEMAKTQIDTVQAVVTEYDDHGFIKDVTVTTGQTSALAIAVPPALAFKRVHHEGRFQATEFSSAAHSNVNVNLIGVNVSGRGFRGISAGGSITNVNTDVQTEQTQDSSVASMSMTAQIRPKPVPALAKPPLILKGPTLDLSVSGSIPVIDVIHPVAGDPPPPPPYLEKRSAIVHVLLSGTSSSADGKTIAIDAGGLDWGVTDPQGLPLAAGPKTANGGEFYIKVSRTAASNTEAKKDFVIRASLNLVNATLNVSL
jgi:hypothetical protein